MSGPTMLWLDLETTGLDPLTGVVLEMYAVATGDDLEPLDAGVHGIIDPDTMPLRAFPSRWDPVVVEMHERSGLLPLLRNVPKDEGMIDMGGLWVRLVEHPLSILPGYIRQHWSTGDLPLLAGSSVHFDRGWLPGDTLGLLHHRNLDVSVLAESARRWWPSIAAGMPRGRGMHRARPDVEDSLTLAAYLRDAVTGGKSWLDGVA